MMLSTDTGRLNQRITIQQLSVKVDGIGNQTSEWTDFYSCWAAVNGLSGREYWEARQQHEENTVNFKVRFCKKLKELNTTGFCIKFRGRFFDIVSVDNMQFVDSLINIKAVERCDHEQA